MKIEFLDYTPTPTEKHLGIASVMIDDIIVLKYKIVPGKQDKGFYIQTSSLKTSETDYTPSFIVDSRKDEESIKETIRIEIKACMDRLEGISDVSF
jgi:hypothetical protein